MTGTLLQMGLSNACIAAGLAVVALFVGWKAKRPHLAHLLWLLVFVKLVTPPVVSVPLFEAARPAEEIVVVVEHTRAASPIADSSGGNNTSDAPIAPNDAFVVETSRRTPPTAHVASTMFLVVRQWLPPIWLLGGAAVFFYSLFRVWRFGRLLAAESRPAADELRSAAVRIAHRLGMKSVPTIRTTSARISPMVWWAGRRVQVVLPGALLEEMEAAGWQWILAHELAHVRRGDHIVRWLEWAACVVFWWNPVVWWARRNLRATEEICCDALVLSSLRPKPQAYANSLLTAVEFLAAPVLRPPAMASEINSGGFLERRFRMIVSKTEHRANPRWLKVAVLLCAVAVLPLGIAYATDYDAVAGRLKEAVDKGEISPDQAEAMMDALKRPADKGTDSSEENPLEAMGARLKAIGERLKDAVKEGDLTEDQAWAKWQVVRKEARAGLEKAVDVGKATGTEAKAFWRELEKAEAGEKLKAAVARGEISEEDAREKWNEIAGDDGGKRDEGDLEDRIKNQIKSVIAPLKAAVEEGDLSEEDAWAKWHEVKEREIIPRIKRAVQAGRMAKEKAHAIVRELQKAEINEIAKAAIAKGELPAREAKKTLTLILSDPGEEGEGEHAKKSHTIEVHVQGADQDGKSLKTERKLLQTEKRVIIIHPKTSEGDDEDGREKQFRVIEAQIDDAVKDGKLSKEEAEKKLIIIRAKLLDDKDGEDQDDQGNENIRVRTYHAMEAAIDAAVKAGKLSEREAKEKQIALRKQILEDRDDHHIPLKRIQGELQAAVKAGRMSAEDARAKISAVRKRLAEVRKDRTEKARIIEVQIDDDAKDGKLSKEEAEKKVIVVRGKLLGNEGDEGDEGRLQVVARRLEAAVKAGKMSPAEAWEKLRKLVKEEQKEEDDD